MASFNRSEYVDSLTVNNIFTRAGNNNSNIPAYRVLTTDGAGGTMWMTFSSISSLQYGAGFHTIKTSLDTYTANDATNATLFLLDGPNAGLINDPTALNTARLYAKAFGQFDISGGNSLSAFDSVTRKVNSNVLFVGTGGINIKGDPQTNTMYFDGRELPFISTMPYSFNQLQVFSNAPLNTIFASTLNKSLLMQAQGPSSIISFLGEDIIVIETNYENNQIKFKLSTLTLQVISSVIGNVERVVSTYVTRVDLSTLSTSYQTILSFESLQINLSTAAKSINQNISTLSSSYGRLDRYSDGISTIWRTFQLETFYTGTSSVAKLLSTSESLQNEINILSNYVFPGFNTIVASTIQTPFFAVSTQVVLDSIITSSINTPINSINPINIKYYPTYASFYNVFNDTEPFGNPLSPPIYPTSFNIGTGTTTISTMSTTSGLIFSSMYAVKGRFIFYPNNEPHEIKVKWSGNLSMNIAPYETQTNLASYNIGSSNTAYPRLNAFSNNADVTNYIGANIYIVNFTYSKINPQDYLTLSNFTDYIGGNDLESYTIAPIYSAYGYNTMDTPLYSQSLSSFPLAFSSFSNPSISPYLELSSYVMVASSFYISGCNTTFPISSYGYTSISFLESTTQIKKSGFSQNMAQGVRSDVGSNFSASNAFNYGFTTAIPNSPYTFQLVFGRQQNTEVLRISSIYKEIKSYSLFPLVYASSVIYTDVISSSKARFSELSSSKGTIPALYVSSINNMLLGELDSSTISTIYRSIILLTSTVSTNINLYSTTLIQYDSTITGNIKFLTNIICTSIDSYSTSLIYTNSDSTISTMNAGLEELLSSISSSLNYYSSSLVQYGTSSDSTISTLYTNIVDLTSSILEDTNIFSTSLIEIATTSTISTIVNNVARLSTTQFNYINNSNASTISTLAFKVSSISFEVRTSTLFTSSVQIAGYQQPFIQYGLSPALGTAVAGSPYAGLGAAYAYSTITLETPYKNTAYAVQLTYNGAGLQTIPLQANILTSNKFDIIGPGPAGTYSGFWTTHGSIF
jgi:hypothetical protein